MLIGNSNNIYIFYFSLYFCSNSVSFCRTAQSWRVRIRWFVKCEFCFSAAIVATSHVPPSLLIYAHLNLHTIKTYSNSLQAVYSYHGFPQTFPSRASLQTHTGVSVTLKIILPPALSVCVDYFSEITQMCLTATCSQNGKSVVVHLGTLVQIKWKAHTAASLSRTTAATAASTCYNM